MMQTVDKLVQEISAKIESAMNDAITEAVNCAVQAERQAWRDTLIQIGAVTEWRKALLLMNVVAK